ncbi:MAG: hypothetical protein ACI8U3_000716 [Brevundimonas sp.]|jgi:hypothetical protein
MGGDQTFSRWEKGEPAHRSDSGGSGAGDEGRMARPDPHPAREERMHAHPCAQPSPTGRGSNAARGEVTAELAGAPRRLCLTLGALAEMEGALRVEGIEALAARMRALSAGDLMAVLAALLRGGGEHELAEGLSAARVDARAAAEAVAAAFAAAV